MDNNSSDGRRDGVEYTQQVGTPVAGEGRMPEMPGLRATTPTSSDPPRRIGDGVEVCPQPGNKRGAVGEKDAQRGGGNIWQPQHFDDVADAMGTCVGSNHGNVRNKLRDLTSTTTAVTVDDTSWE